MWSALFLIISYLFALIACADDRVSCFRERTTLPSLVLDRAIAPTTFHACYQVIKFLVRHERTDLPLLFSRIPGKGYLLPEHWRFSNCLFILDTHSDADEETTTFRQIAVEASTILLACVAQPPHLGGTQTVGPKAVMNVTVTGLDFRPPAALPLLAFNRSLWNASVDDHETA